MKKGTAIFPGWLFPFVYCVAGVDAYEDKESFIEWLEREGYQVKWSANRKHITFVTPEGYRCRDTSLHDETFLKDNLEWLFLYRQLYGFDFWSEEPADGWLSEVSYNAEALTRYLGQAMDVPDPPPIPVWTESKQRQREAPKLFETDREWAKKLTPEHCIQH